MNAVWWTVVVVVYLTIGLVFAAVMYELVTGGFDRLVERPDVPAELRTNLVAVRTTFDAARERAAALFAVMLLAMIVAWPGMLWIASRMGGPR